MNGVQIRFGDFIHAIKKRWKLIMGLTLMGLAMGVSMLVISYIRGTNMNYQVKCSFALTSQNSSGKYLDNADYFSQDDFVLATDMVDAATYVLKSDKVLDTALKDAGITGVSASDVSKNLELSQYNETQILEMTLNWNDEDSGLKLTKAILTAAETELPTTLQVGQVAVINDPKASYKSLGSSHMMWIILAGTGFLIGLLVAVLDLLMRPTLLSLEDVDEVFGLETLGVIPENARAFRRGTKIPVANTGKASDVEQNYASVAFILQNLMSNEGCHSLYVTSTVDGEGKTVAAASIAVQLAAMEHTVLMVDLDTHNPCLGGYFLDQVEYDQSLNALYRGDILPQEAIHKLNGYLSLLPMVMDKNTLMMDSSVLNLVRSLGEKYEYVIIDASAVGMYSSPLLLNRITDGAVYVVSYDTAVMQEIVSGIDKLRKSGTRIFGCVVNRATALNSAVVRKEQQESGKMSMADMGEDVYRNAPSVYENPEEHDAESQGRDEGTPDAESYADENTDDLTSPMPSRMDLMRKGKTSGNEEDQWLKSKDDE